MARQQGLSEKRQTVDLAANVRWRAKELAWLLDSVVGLYAVLALLTDEEGPGQVMRRLVEKFVGESATRRRSGSTTGRRRVRAELEAWKNEFWINSIKIGSPGIISLEGLGEPIRELRELIKDLVWRNKHEREMAQIEKEKARLDILEQRIRMLKEVGYTPQAVALLLDEAHGKTLAIGTAVRTLGLTLQLPEGSAKE